MERGVFLSIDKQINDFHVARRQMVEEQLIRRGIQDKRVLAAMKKIPRHLFVAPGLRDQAYLDGPLTIGEGQTISQPYMVAIMTELLELRGEERVLELGTGSGYQGAVLCELCKHLYSIERIASLSHRARRVLYSLSYVNFTLKVGDGTEGWPEEAPYDGIIATAGSPRVPKPLLNQLAEGGSLVIPIGGSESQVLKRIKRIGPRFVEEDFFGCRFVKLVGEHGWKSD